MWEDKTGEKEEEEEQEEEEEEEGEHDRADEIWERLFRGKGENRL